MVHYLSNKELADIFARIGDLLEIKGEVIYKILAYRKAADTIREHTRPVKDVWREGGLREIPGVGQAIAEKIDELLTTGKLAFLEKLQTEVPASLTELLQVPDLGPKRVALVWKKLGVTTLAELDRAARAGELRGLAGMGEKSEAKILLGIESLKRATGRVPLGKAWPVALEILRILRALPGVSAAESAGSLRRGRSTIGDLDFIVAAVDSRPVMATFMTLPLVARVLGQGPTKTSVVLENGLQADLRVLPPERFGTLLQYFTGSKDHNVRLRELAQSHGLSLNEHAFVAVDGRETLCATEADVYRALGLPYIPPELREDRGELQAARDGKLPRLIELRDLQSDLHTHSTWSDGKASVLEMAQAARVNGLKCLAVTDHSHGLGVTNGLTPERLRAQRREIDAAQAQLGAGFVLLQGSEVEIRADGTLDFTDDVLGDLDIVVASLHTALGQEREKITERLLNAVRNHNVDIIGHPTGRRLPNRDGADLDLEAVFKAAAESGVALEINANPERLDLDDVYARRALELGCLLAINTDAHGVDWFGHAQYGVVTARRAWATSDRVINTWPVEKLLSWLDERDRRRGAGSRVGELHSPQAHASASEPPAKKPSGSKRPAAKPAGSKEGSSGATPRSATKTTDAGASRPKKKPKAQADPPAAPNAAARRKPTSKPHRSSR